MFELIGIPPQALFGQLLLGLINFGGMLRHTLFDIAVIVPTVPANLDAVDEQ